MFEQLIHFDQHLFHIINHDWANPFFDWVMPWLRLPTFWIPLYLFIIVFCLWKYKKRGIIIILFIVGTFGVSDFTSASLIKPYVHRLRPCRDPVVSKTDVERIPCGSGYSFPSSHATNHFAMAIIMAFIFCKRWRWVWLWAILWAASISFAQVYVGVHFPIDVTCGALYGSFVGWLMSRLYYWMQGSIRNGCLLFRFIYDFLQK